MLFEAFGKLSKTPLLAVIPLVVDGLSVLLSAATHGFQSSQHFTFKISLQMGLPSISSVIEQSFMPGSVQIVGAGFNTSSFFGILFLLALFIIVQSFLQGGYVGLLYEASQGCSLSMVRFTDYGKRFLGRFFLLNIVVLTFVFILGGLAAAILKIPGVIMFMLFFLLLRVLFLYLEFTIIADDCSISQAFSRSRDTFRRRTPSTLLLVGTAFVVNIVAGLLVNALWQPFFFLVFLVAYDIVSAGLQLAFMHDYRRIRG